MTLGISLFVNLFVIAALFPVARVYSATKDFETRYLAIECAVLVTTTSTIVIVFGTKVRKIIMQILLLYPIETVLFLIMKHFVYFSANFCKRL